MSKDIPIIFSGPMVRALLDGRKTMTRRILKKGLPPAPAMDAINPANVVRHPAPYFDSYRNEPRSPDNPLGMSRNWCWWTRDDRQCLPTINVRFQPGDRLWVRENFAHVGTCDPGFLTFQATYPGDLAHHGMENVPATLKEVGYHWIPSIHMPRALSRLTLIVTGVKVERLDSISREDALAEGCKAIRDACYVFDGTAYDRGGLCHNSPVTAFSILWDDLHGDGAWEQNPFVVAVSFRIINANIDAPEARLAA